MAKPRDTANLVSNIITHADTSNLRLGIRKTNPATTLDVNGDVTANGQVLATAQVTLTNLPIFRHVSTISSNYTVTSTYNEMSTGRITINSGSTVIINAGATWSIL